MAKPQKRSERKVNLLDFVDPSAALPSAPSSAPSSGSNYLRRDEASADAGGGGWRSGPRTTDNNNEAEGVSRRGGYLRREEPLPPAASDEDFQWRKKQPSSEPAAPIARGSLRSLEPAEPSQAEQDSNWRKAQKPVEPAAVLPPVAQVEPSQAEQDTNWRKAQPAPVTREKPALEVVDTSGNWRKPKEETEPAAPLRRGGGLRQDDSWRTRDNQQQQEEDTTKFKADSSWRSDKKDIEPSSRFAAFSKREPLARLEANEDAPKPFLRSRGGDDFPSAFRSKELSAAPQREQQQDDFPASFRKSRIAPLDPVTRPPREDFPAAFQGGGGLRRNAPDPTFRREDYAAFQGSFRNRDEGGGSFRNRDEGGGSSRAFGGDRNRDEGNSYRAFGGGDRNRDEGNSYRAFGGGDRAPREDRGGSFRSRQDDASFGAFRSGGGKPEFSRGSSRFEESTPLPTAPASVVAAAAAAAAPVAAAAPAAAPAPVKQKKSLEQCAVTIAPMLKDYMVDEDRSSAVQKITSVLADTDAAQEYIAKCTEQVTLQKTDSAKETKLVMRLLVDISKLNLQAFCEGLCLAYDADEAKAKSVFTELCTPAYLPELAKEEFRVAFVPAKTSMDGEDGDANESKEIKLLRQILASADLSADEEITWVKSNSSKLAKLYDAPKQERIQAVLLVEDAFNKVNFMPKGRVEEAFQALLDVCVLSPEAFIDWRDDPVLMDKPTPGRQRALFQTTGFFLDLEEEEEEEEEDEDEDYE